MYHSSFGKYLDNHFSSTLAHLRETTLQELLVTNEIKPGFHWRPYKRHLLVIDCREELIVAGVKLILVRIYYPDEYALGAIELVEEMINYSESMGLSKEERELILQIIRGSTLRLNYYTLCDTCYRINKDCPKIRFTDFCSRYVPDIL